ncbi:MAG: YggS family pyridoxal phosphate-dependent enzyme, partial [Synergistaceae bacterium]|nr:YggS family pyridoxal phosphate-dependent enzyme [Synergistaceae bacterium]
KEVRKAFALLRSICEASRERTGLPLPELSMGMSGDFAWAIAEGSTMVRIGSSIFGPRG